MAPSHQPHLSFRILLIAVVLAAPFSALSSKLPSNLKRCARTDPKFQECLKDAVADAIPKLKNGLPTFGMPPLDPLYVENISVQQGSRSLNIKFSFLNATLRGFTSGTLTETRFDNKSLKWHFSYGAPRVDVEGNYVVEGKFLIVPIQGHGKVTMSFWDPSVTQEMESVKVKKADGKEYLKFDNIAVNVTLGGKNHIKYESAVNTDKRFAEAINKLVNENVKLITNEAMPAISTAMGNIFKLYTSTIFDKVPYNDIFPETL